MTGCHLTLTSWSGCDVASGVCGGSASPRQATGPARARTRLQAEAATRAERLFGERDARRRDALGESVGWNCRRGMWVRTWQEGRRWWGGDGRRREQGRLELPAWPPALGEGGGARRRANLDALPQRGGAAALGHGAGRGVHVGVLGLQFGALPGQGGPGRPWGAGGGGGEAEGRTDYVVIQEELLRPLARLAAVTRGHRWVRSWRTEGTSGGCCDWLWEKKEVNPSYYVIFLYINLIIWRNLAEMAANV